jgi:hypothetical protein
MALVEIARFADVYEADLAAAFLASHDIEVSVTERYQTTVDPLMQRALGIRLMTRADQAGEARDLLARARAGEFAAEDGDDIAPMTDGARATGGALAVVAFVAGGFWGSSLPRRFRGASWQGMLLAVALTAALLAAVMGGAWLIHALLINPP